MTLDMPGAEPGTPLQPLSELRATSVWVSIEAALRRLPGLPPGEATEARLRRACDGLAGIAHHAKDPPTDVPFRRTNRKTARAELDKLANLAEALADHAETLHEPAILALAEVHLTRAVVAGFAREVSARARNADVNHVPETVGRGKEQSRQLAMMVGALCHDDFTELTGRRPAIRMVDDGDKAGGPFLDLLREVFGILAINASAENVARETIMEKKVAKK